tara:strand:+ start:298 stop:456 length:159 start_codon:yes stop_codon:yes gene_type:complete
LPESLPLETHLASEDRTKAKNKALAKKNAKSKGIKKGGRNVKRPPANPGRKV